MLLVRGMAAKASGSSEPYVVITKEGGVTTIRMNRPKRLNGWTKPMMEGVVGGLNEAAAEVDTKVVVLTGTDPYYSAGVDLGGEIMKPQHPRKLFDTIVKQNSGLFDQFIEFPKPIIVAVNGPAIGATVTSATLCDAIIASENATFSTPFAALGIVPEGCSSVHFERLMGSHNAQRMLGDEGWKPTAAEAAEVGLITEVAPHDKFLARAQALAKEWAASGKKRWLHEEGKVAEYKDINMRESEALAHAFLGEKFLRKQHEFLKSKYKHELASVFKALLVTRPLWIRLL